jgi:hypothetical protein
MALDDWILWGVILLMRFDVLPQFQTIVLRKSDASRYIFES